MLDIAKFVIEKVPFLSSQWEGQLLSSMPFRHVEYARAFIRLPDWYFGLWTAEYGLRWERISRALVGIQCCFTFIHVEEKRKGWDEMEKDERAHQK